jgi:hypothetical protein
VRSIKGQRPRTAASNSQAMCRTSAVGDASHICCRITRSVGRSVDRRNLRRTCIALGGHLSCPFALPLASRQVVLSRLMLYTVAPLEA